MLWGLLMIQEPRNKVALIMSSLVYRGLAVFCITGMGEEIQRGG